MPKNPTQDKKTVPKRGSHPSRGPARSRFRAAPQGLEDIMKKQGWLAGLQRVRSDQQAWLERVAALLPEELRGSLVNVVRRGEQLTVLTASAAWSSRVRFALAALEPQLLADAPDIVKVVVRVSPAGRAG
jgi:hypothetical protein